MLLAVLGFITGCVCGMGLMCLAAASTRDERFADKMREDDNNENTGTD